MAIRHSVITILLFISAHVTAADRPNILLLLADDMGYNDLAVNNGNDMPTPALDRLANESIRFKRFYADATCQPARAALLSGRYPARAGFRPVGRGLPPEWTTLPEALKAQGYRTHHVGKWHLGHTPRQAWPTEQGFDTSFGFLNQWMLGGPVAEGQWSLTPPTYHNPWLNRGLDQTRQYPGHLEDILTDETTRLIRNADQSAPWFIYHAFYAPHTPHEPAERYRTLYPDTAEGIFRAVIHQLDDSVQQILQSLEDSGQADNTIVIFASDNGGTNVARDNNAPFAGKKGEFREGGIRTFMLWRWPDRAVTGIDDSVTSIMDIYPSLLADLGVEPGNEFDGISLFNESRKPDVAQRTLFWELGISAGGYRAVLSEDGRWHYINVGTSLALHEARIPGENSNAWWRVPTWYTLENQYRLWRVQTEQSEVKVVDRSASGHARVEGDNFQRTPGLSGFSFGVGIYPDTGPDAWQVLVDQPGVWRLEYHARQGLRGTINGLPVAVDMTFPQETCSSVVVTGYWFLPSLLWGGEPDSGVQLYVNGERVTDASGKYRDVSAAAVEVPTWIGLAADGSQPFSGRLGMPRFLNTALADGWLGDVAEFSESLCQD